MMPNYFQQCVIYQHLQICCMMILKWTFIISEWSFKWKMIPNPDITKVAQEVIFFIKIQKQIIPLLNLMKHLLQFHFQF